MTAFLLSAVGGSRWQTGIALSANHLVAVVLGGKGFQRRLDDSTSESEDKV